LNPGLAIYSLLNKQKLQIREGFRLQFLNIMCKKNCWRLAFGHKSIFGGANLLNNAVNRLILVDTINTLGTAITWTGLPIFALNLTGSFLYAGSLYLTETIAGIISTIVSGHFIDKVSSKKMIFTSFFLNCFVMITLFSLLSFKHFIIFLFPLMILSQSLGHFANLCLEVWFRDLTIKDPNIGLARAISKKNTFTTTCKTVGFTIGPLIFGILSSYAILIDSASFLVCAFLIMRFDEKIQIEHSHDTAWFSLAYLKRTLKDKILRIYFFSHLLGGMIGPVMTSLSVYILEGHFKVADFEISIFWLVGGIFVILSNMILSRSSLLFASKVFLYFLTVFLVCGGIVMMGASLNWIFFIVGFAIMTMGNPVINNLLSAETFKAIPQYEKGKVMGVMEASADLGTLSFMIISWGLIETFGIFITCMIIAIMAILRITLFYSSFKIKPDIPIENITKNL